MSKHHSSCPRTPAKTMLLASLALAFSGCGGGEQNGAGASGNAMGTSGDAVGQERRMATVRWDDQAMEFTGRSCFLTESGGSQGAVDLSDWTSDDGAELSLDWAGDSRMYGMARIEFADGRELVAMALESGAAPLEVAISGSTATIRTNLRELMTAASEPTPATIEVHCP